MTGSELWMPMIAGPHALQRAIAGRNVLTWWRMAYRLAMLDHGFVSYSYFYPASTSLASSSRVIADLSVWYAAPSDQQKPLQGRTMYLRK